MNVNVPLLSKILGWAYEQHQLNERGLPSEWNQRHWVRSDTAVACGTVCCVAGKAALESGWTVAGPHLVHDDPDCVTVLRDGERQFIGAAAAAELGLTETQADGLFHPSNTIWDLYRQAEKITDGAITAPDGLGV